jgi:outer membrane protein
LYTASRLLILLSIFVSGTILACSRDETCIEKSSWQFGIAFGIGVKTNPLVDGDNIPLVILPDIAWYAEKAYFDNGELGYQWLNQPKFAVETFLQLDRENAFFSFLHPANILIPTDTFASASDSNNSPVAPGTSVLPGSSISLDEGMQDNQRSLSVDEVASRKWAINGGIRGHYFFSNSEWQLSFKQDISNVHKGQQVGLQYNHRWLWQMFRFTLRTGTDWKSARVNDYYYGISQRDTDLTELYFNGESGWQTYMSLNAQKSINENWSWLAKIGYRRFPSSFVKSPLIEANNIRNAFLGVAYRF